MPSTYHTSILKPFLDQFRWSRSVLGPETEFWIDPLLKFQDDLQKALDEAPFASVYHKFYQREQENFPLSEYISVEASKELQKIKVNEALWKNYRGFMTLSVLMTILSLTHYLSRALVGLPGALFEWAERKTENNPWLKPLKLLFYLLKQPFKWAETAVSSAFQLIDGAILLAYSAGCRLFSFLSSIGKKEVAIEMLETKEAKAKMIAPLSLKDRANQSYDAFLEKTGRAAARLFIVGLIGVGAYFGGPPLAAALTGTLGAVGAGCAVAGTGLVGMSVIQYVALSLKERFKTGGEERFKGVKTSGIQAGVSDSGQGREEPTEEQTEYKALEDHPYLQPAPSRVFKLLPSSLFPRHHAPAADEKSPSNNPVSPATEENKTSHTSPLERKTGHG